MTTGRAGIARSSHATKTVFVFAGDPGDRDALSAMLRGAGYGVESFADPKLLVAAATDIPPACIILDLSGGDLSYRTVLDILEALDARRYPAPIVVAARGANVQMAVAAIRQGAAEFIDMPDQPQALAGRVQAVIDKLIREFKRPSRPAPQLPQFAGIELLTARERAVLAHLIRGASNRQMAALLAISPRTIEVHRARIMRKLRARKIASLIRIVLGTGRPD
jgi:FixJ family two-component response regulator